MTDRELLELAAWAAGYVVEECAVGGAGALFLRGELSPWNPLTDDGDAFRLAVKLNIVPRSINGVVFAWREGLCDMMEPHNGDPYAATRRAIVRAAAEIGKQAPNAQD